MKDIINYIKVNENLATSGQPTKEQFEIIANEGYTTIINLAVCSCEVSIEKEDEVVSALGMNYIHIPVDFDNPTVNYLKDFIQILIALNKSKVWVHCILNYKASAFMYVYHKYILKTPFEKIDLKIFEEWGPSQKWQTIMKTPFEKLN